MNKPGIINFSAAGLLLALACGEPLPAQPSQWRLAAEIPRNYPGFSPTAVGPRGLYGIDMSAQGLNRLVAYDGNSFRLDYEPAADVESLDSVGFYGDQGWLSGVKGPEAYSPTGPNPRKGFVLRYEGGKWAEDREEFPNVSRLYCITPIGPNEFYCLATEPGIGYQPSYVGKYTDGSIKIFYSLGPTESLAYAKDINVIFGLRSGEAPRKVIASGDAGATWVSEDITAPTGYEITQILSFSTSPDALYIMVTLKAEEQEWYAIIKRTGVPGEGLYDVSYLGAVGPGRFQLNKCAFRAAADGLAVGWSATMRYDGALWTAEFCGEYESYEGLAADPRGGFWAVTPSGDNLYWHP